MNKCVIILDEKLPLGLLANASAVIAMTIGKKVDRIIGDNIIDASNQVHQGITNHVLPILKTHKTNLINICETAKMDEELLVVDFCDIAQRSKNYDDYSMLLQKTKGEDLRYLGIGIYGKKETVNRLSGSLSLLR